VTQHDAARLHGEHRRAGGLRWWSRLESSWINVTLFDRVASRVSVTDVRPLDPGEDAVRHAAEHLGLRTA
jgi:hypothetical protein